MDHLIIYEIATVDTCLYRYLFDENYIEILTNKETFKSSNIYFICKKKKVRFNLEKTFIVENIYVQTEVIVRNGNSFDVKLSLYDMFEPLQLFFPTKEIFNGFICDKISEFEIVVNRESSKGEQIVVDLIIPGGERIPIYLQPENCEYFGDLDLKNEPETLYIGQSINMLSRIQSHKSLHKSVSQISEDEDVLLYFLTFKYAYGGDREVAPMFGENWNFWLNIDPMSNGYKSKNDLIERTLIHFFKPIYNDYHTKMDIMKDKLVNEIVLENKITSMTIGMSIHGFGYKFWTKSQPVDTELFSFDFRNPHLGYTEGMILDI